MMDENAICNALAEAKHGGLEIIGNLTRLHYDRMNIHPAVCADILADSIRAAKEILFALQKIQETK